MRNSKGERILPCRTPGNTGSILEVNLVDLSDKYDLNQDQSLLEIPADHSLTRSWLWDTELKSLWMLKYVDDIMISLGTTDKDLVGKDE